MTRTGAHGGVWVWRALQPWRRRTRGMAATAGVGVGLGGDQRSRQPLSWMGPPPQTGRGRVAPILAGPVGRRPAAPRPPWRLLLEPVDVVVGRDGPADVVALDRVAAKRVQLLPGGRVLHPPRRPPASPGCDPGPRWSVRRAVTAAGVGRSCEGGATEVPPPTLVLLPRRSGHRHLLAMPRVLAQAMGMVGQPRGAASQRVAGRPSQADRTGVLGGLRGAGSAQPQAVSRQRRRPNGRSTAGMGASLRCGSRTRRPPTSARALAAGPPGGIEAADSASWPPNAKPSPASSTAGDDLIVEDARHSWTARLSEPPAAGPAGVERVKAGAGGPRMGSAARGVPPGGVGVQRGRPAHPRRSSQRR